MPVLNAADRLRLRQLYAFRCGYCGISETDAGAELTEDHFQPVSAGGTNDFSNVVYACHVCNEFKSDHWNPLGPDRILHPLDDEVTDHIAVRPDGVLTALTTTGAFHIRKLRLNRSNLVAHRREQESDAASEHRLASIEEKLEALAGGLDEVHRAIRVLSSRRRR